LSAIGHGAALSLVVCLVDGMPPTWDSPAQTIPLVFVEEALPPSSTGQLDADRHVPEATVAEPPSAPVAAEASSPDPVAEPPSAPPAPQPERPQTTASAPEPVRLPESSTGPIASPAEQTAPPSVAAEMSVAKPQPKRAAKPNRSVTAKQRRKTLETAVPMPSSLSTAAPSHSAMSQSAAVPPSGPTLPPTTSTQEIGTEYRRALSAWLERHKVYPEAARRRGEEGGAVLRFRIDRAGRVLDYRLIRSTGYPELDAAIDRMMHSATLPPFPAGMVQSEIAVSVPIRFNLSR
jgi:periplasmic protein TonB